MTQQTPIQELWPDVYTSFFHSHDCVVSAPYVMNLMPTFLNILRGDALTQKTPFKMFVGLNRIEDKQTTIGVVHAYDVTKNIFHIHNAYHIFNYPEKVEKFVTQYLQDNHSKYQYQIDIVAEKSRGQGFGGAIIAALAIAKALLQQTLQEEDDEKLLHLAKQIYSQATGSENPRASFAHTIVAGDKGVVHVTEKKTDSIGELPLDFAVLHMGINYDWDVSMKLYQQFIQTMSDDPKYAKSWEIILRNHKDKYIQAVKNYIHKPHATQQQHEVLQLAQHWGLLSQIIETNNIYMAQIESLFHVYRSLPTETLSLFAFTTAEDGGSIMVMMPAHKSRTTLQKVINHLKTNGYPSVTIDYANWIHGTSSDTVKIEQHLSQGLYGSYTHKNMMLVKTLTGDQKILDRDMIQEQYKDYLIFDTQYQQVRYHGQVVDSKKLQSQTFTVDMMSLLIDNLNIPVDNDQLPVSSYSKARNQIAGKILGPLYKLTAELFNEEIRLHCKGKAHEFTLTLDKSTLPVAVIQRVLL